MNFKYTYIYGTTFLVPSGFSIKVKELCYSKLVVDAVG